MFRQFQPRLALTALVCVGLLLGACTRSAGVSNLPTATTIGGDPLGVGGGDQDATMAAIGTLITGQATQTAVAVFMAPSQLNSRESYIAALVP